MSTPSPLFQSAQQHRVAPSENAWLKLDAKLEKSRNVKKLTFYRNISVAAVSVALLGVISVWIAGNDIEVKTNSNAVMAHVYSDQIESIPLDKADGIYEISKLYELKRAYEKLATRESL
ncbi:MAG: hypothetical protein IPN89_07740 [Saprospiraceae bacterium]|nr:hypothetical protein [Saprospiraceae bacterium]